MTGNARRIARIALFSALIYVFSWSTAALPNIKLIFFIVFSAGYLWGMISGMLVGATGMGLWTFFNPFGPAPIPVAMAQIIGASLCGAVGFSFRNLINPKSINWLNYVFLVSAGMLCTLIFFVPVSLVDAWLFQPFKERFFSGMIFSVGALISNMIIFPLLFRLLQPFYLRERNQQ